MLSIFQDRVDEEFSRKQIIDLVVNAYPETNHSSIIPSDYCYNSVNQDSTSFNLFLFESLGDGTFKCLGPGYLYSGPIYWKGEQVGNGNRENINCDKILGNDKNV